MKKSILVFLVFVSPFLFAFKLAVPTNGTYGISAQVVQSQSTIPAAWPTWQQTMVAQAQTAVPGQLSLTGYFKAEWRAVGLYGWNASYQDPSREPVTINGFTPTPNQNGNYNLSLQNRVYPQYKVHKNSAGNYFVFEVQNTATVTNTPTFTADPTHTNTFTSTNTYTSTNTFTPSATMTHTSTPTGTLTPATNTITQTYTSTPSYTATNTYTATASYTPTNTPTSTNSFTPTGSATPTFTVTATFTGSWTAVNTNTPTNTYTPSPTCTCAASYTPQCWNE